MEITNHRGHLRMKIVALALTAVAFSFGALAQRYLGTVAAASSAAGPGDSDSGGAAGEKNAAARAAFLETYKVFMHPRCMNCHPRGDVPLQGDDNRLHIPGVKRGPAGKGVYALKCANCHQHTNLPGEHMPPGNPNWHLPPPEMRMVFEGKTPAELARQLKDPKQNGGKTLEQILHHVTHDQLVLWGWHPGDGRTTPPLSHAEFTRKFREWVEQGAPVPE
jgi:hypothetical protein